MQYCSLQHRTLLPSPVTSTTGHCFCFDSVSSFFLVLFLHPFLVAYWSPTDLGSSSFSVLELTPNKDVLFINAKVGSQEIPGITGKFDLRVQNEAGKRLTEFCQKNTLVIANTLLQQHKKRLYIWTSPDGQYQKKIDYFFCNQRWRQSAKTRPGDDCGSDHELLIAKFRLKLKKVGKTTRPFRYDLQQFPYDYILKVANRFKGLNLIECLKNYGQRFMTLHRRQ